MGQVHGGPRVALILPVSPLTPLRHLRCARVPRLSLSLHLSPPRRAPLFPLSCRCTCHRIRSLAIVVVTVMPVMVVVGRYLLRRGWGIRKIEKRKDKKRVPTTHALAPSLSLSLFGWSRGGGSLSIRNLGQWNENGTRAPIHRPGASSATRFWPRVCASIYRRSSTSEYYSRWKNRVETLPRGGDRRRDPFRSCLDLLFHWMAPLQGHAFSTRPGVDATN